MPMSERGPLRVLLLGTGTNVGKTHVGCALANSLVQAGAHVLALKPVESGTAEVPAESTDAGRLAQAAHHPYVPPLHTFPAALGPHRLAREQGITISPDDIAKWVVRQESEHSPAPDITLIETAGAAYSPLSQHHRNADLIRTLRPHLLILIAPDRLGVLHDTYVTLRALRAEPEVPVAYVLSAAPPHDSSTNTNAEEVETLKLAVVTATIAAGQTSAPELATLVLNRKRELDGWNA